MAGMCPPAQPLLVGALHPLAQHQQHSLLASEMTGLDTLCQQRLLLLQQGAPGTTQIPDTATGQNKKPVQLYPCPKYMLQHPQQHIYQQHIEHRLSSAAHPHAQSTLGLQHHQQTPHHSLLLLLLLLHPQYCCSCFQLLLLLLLPRLLPAAPCPVPVSGPCLLPAARNKREGPRTQTCSRGV